MRDELVRGPLIQYNKAQLTYVRVLATSLLLAALFAGQTMSGSVAYTYDDAGRLIEADYGNGKVFSYTYDDAAISSTAR